MKEITIKIVSFTFSQDTVLTTDDDYDTKPLEEELKQGFYDKAILNLKAGNGIVGIDFSKVVTWSLVCNNKE